MLSDFIQWEWPSIPPTDRIGSLNHGGQFVGYGGDSQEGSLNHPMGDDRWVKSHQAAIHKGQDKNDFIAFDVEANGGAEILGDFTLCRYFSLAQNDYGDGWDYDKTLNDQGESWWILKNSPERGRILEHPSWQQWIWHTCLLLTYEQVRIFSQRSRVFSSIKLYGQTGGEEVLKIRAEPLIIPLHSDRRPNSHSLYRPWRFREEVHYCTGQWELKKASFNLYSYWWDDLGQGYWELAHTHSLFIAILITQQMD